MALQAPDQRQDSVALEKSDSDSATPATDTSDVCQYKEAKSAATAELSADAELSDEKARFLDLRDNLAHWQWIVFYLIGFFGAAISGMQSASTIPSTSIAHSPSHNLSPFNYQIA